MDTDKINARILELQQQLKARETRLLLSDGEYQCAAGGIRELQMVLDSLKPKQETEDAKP